MKADVGHQKANSGKSRPIIAMYNSRILHLQERSSHHLDKEVASACDDSRRYSSKIQKQYMLKRSRLGSLITERIIVFVFLITGRRQRNDRNETIVAA